MFGQKRVRKKKKEKDTRKHLNVMEFIQLALYLCIKKMHRCNFFSIAISLNFIHFRQKVGIENVLESCGYLCTV